MVTLGIIFVGIALLGLVFTAWVAQDKDALDVVFFAVLCGLLFAIGFGTAVVEYDKTHIPSAMDVYQGKTTLEYTVVDGAIKDSTVVWKDILQQ